MPPKYLLFFRAVLAETLLLQSLYAPDLSLGRAWLWLLLGLYAAVTAGLFLVGRRRQLPPIWTLASFFLDIGLTSAILYATGGFSGDFYVTYFLVILSTCFIENLAFSFVVGGLACVVYATMAFPGLEAAYDSFYLLRLSLLLATALFSSIIADHARSIQRRTAAEFEERLAWLQRLSSVGQALARILHELKTPLGTISLSAEYLRERLRQGQTQELEEQLSVVESEAERASAIVRGYLEFCKPVEVSLQPMPIQEPLAQALAAARLRLEDCEVSLEADLSGRTMVLGSPRHLVQLFAILLDNALKAMPLGGSLSVTVESAAAQVRVRLADSGVGLTPEVRARLFEPFTTSRTASGGTGLGLSIARWIVLKHGGDLSLDSPGPARGTVATVCLLPVKKS